MSEKLSGLPVHGYREQTADRVALVNGYKIFEEQLLRQVDALFHDMAGSYDKRMLALARTRFEEGFMWLNRAVFRPERVKLPEDDAPA